MTQGEHEMSGQRVIFALLATVGYIGFSVMMLVRGDHSGAVWWACTAFIAACCLGIVARWFRERG